ncbi:MAG: DNA methylase, partial [Alphaproteobacteria bacterium]
MKVQSIAVAELVNDPANVRKHSGKNLDAIKGSLARFGQQKPIVVGPDGVVVAGNGTLEAAKALGWKKIDAVKTGLKGSDRTAFAIADNRTSELAEWDDAALAEQLSALAIDDEELLAAAGFDEAELERLVSETTGLGDIVEDEAPEPPADPVTKAGDLWQL